MQNLYTEEEMSRYGVYIIKNTINNKIYIGSTIESFEKRIKRHINNFDNWIIGFGRAGCPILYNAFKKYDIENFEFIIYKSFIIKKDSKKTKTIVTYLEEKLIGNLNPDYNVCKYPTLSGVPNLGIKLTEEWKRRIGEKSSLYHHKDNIKNYNKVKETAFKKRVIYEVSFNDKIIKGTLKECAEYYNLDITTLYNYINGKREHSFVFKKLNTQFKKIKIFKENQIEMFNCFSDCDKFLNMWRGFTSTQIVNKKKQILDWDYEVISNDIV